jgi:prepilin-type N-terminal cleavage/methylation domain-containing protein
MQNAKCKTQVPAARRSTIAFCVSRFALSRAKRGFALLEVMVAVLIMGIALLFLLQVRNQTITAYNDSGDQRTAAWLAELKMNEILSERLPDPEDPDTYIIEDSGNFAEFDARMNDFNRRTNEKWVEKNYLARFEYKWTKELIFVGQQFTGNKDDLDNWEQPLDDAGEPTDEKDPRTQPAARVVRVTLEVTMPLAVQRDEEGGLESETALQKRRSVKLVTYLDPAQLKKPAAETTTTGTSGTGGTGK